MTSLTGQNFGHWRVLRTDESGKRVLACCACGAVRQLNLADLQAGTAASSCGCQPPSASEREALELHAARRAKEDGQ
jgi:hypothetical protein